MKYIIKTWEDIAEALHSMRRLSGRTGEEVAREIGLNVTTLYRKENRQTKFDINELVELSKLYGFKIQIIEDEEEL